MSIPVDDLIRWRTVAESASPDAFQYGPSGDDGRSFLVECYDKGQAGPVHAVWFGDSDDSLIVAITGNGPTSEANARHIAWSSPRNVIALIAEVRELRSKLAEAKRIAEEAVDIDPLDPDDAEIMDNLRLRLEAL